MHVLSLLWILCFVSHLVKVRAVKLRGCYDIQQTRVLDLIENQDNVITCEDIQGTNNNVTWGILLSGTFYSYGDCYSNLVCNDQSPTSTTLSRPSYSTSTLTMKNVIRTGIDRQVRCSTTKPPIIDTVNQDTCSMNVIFPAQLSTDCQVQVVNSSRPWMVNGTCIVVKAYTPHREKYNCLWFHTPPLGSVFQIPVSQTQGEPTLTQTGESNTTHPYYTFDCSFQVNLSDVEGNNVYKVTAYPGGVNGSDIIVSVTKPNANPAMSCNTTNGYVPENTDVQCNCTAVDFGEPKGYLQVQRAGSVFVANETDGRNVTFKLYRVNRTNDGETLTCFLYWVKDILVTYNLRVAYGPDLVSINDSGVFDLHPTIPSQLTLTCTVNGFNPGVTYKWNGLCVHSTSNTCYVTPTASNTGNVISCTATNNVTNVQKTSKNLTLTIHYPPSTSPVIRGNTGQMLNSGQLTIYSGQQLTMTCTVGGGYPPVTSVTFSCGNQGQTSNGTSSVISITVDSSNNGQTCECSAIWKNKTQDWYNQTARVTLNVYYAPVAPAISYTGLFPFLDGESPTLVCSFPTGANRGNPPATLSWQGGQGTSGQTEANLTLTPLYGPVDNNRTVVCQANNNFTVQNMTPVNKEFQLQVYYITVSFMPLNNSHCIPTSSPDSDCVVDEGQSVHVNCSAQGNPAIATISWQHVSPRSSILDLEAKSNTSVEQTCDVSTTTVTGDTRLPLNKSRRLHVYTRYTSEIRQLFFNGQPTNLTVNESAKVNVTCTAKGRPTPSLLLANDSTTLYQKDQGPDNSTVDTVSVGYPIANAICENAGQYRCGTSSYPQTALFLFVNCSPRTLRFAVYSHKPFNFMGTPLKIPLGLVAYPQPTSNSFTFLGPSGNLTVPVMQDIMNITCWETGTTYNFTCNITVDNINDTLAGYYSLKLENDFGHAWVNYSVTFNVTKTNPGIGNEVDPAVIGGAVAAALIGAGIVIGIICGLFIYRRRKDPTLLQNRKLHATESKRKTDDEVTITNSLYGTSPISNVTITNSLYGTSPINNDLNIKEEHARNDYEIVDINIPETGPKSKPNIVPKPSPGNENNSDKRTQLNKAADDVYATVVKDKKIAKLQPASTNHMTGTSKASIKMKAGKGDKQKMEKGKGKKKDKIIGNSPLSMKPMDNSVYENYAFQKDDAAFATNADNEDMTPAPETESTSASSSRNHDGLVYVAIDFTPGQQTKAKERPPKRDVTEYAGIDFSKRAHMA